MLSWHLELLLTDARGGWAQQNRLGSGSASGTCKYAVLAQETEELWLSEPSPSMWQHAGR